MKNLKLVVGLLVLASAWLGCAQDVEVGKVRPGAWVLRETSTSNSCAADVDCRQDEVCTAGGRCVRDPQASCSANTDCGPGSLCDATTGLCNGGSGLTCTDTHPCATGETCINGQCHVPDDALHCGADSECRPGEACRNGVCGGGTARCDATTNAGAVSCPFGTSCVNGECQPTPGGGTSCTSDQECQGRPCVNNICGGTDPRTCDQTSGQNACPWGTTCQNGACEPVPTHCDATTNAGQVSCPYGTECVGGVCRPVNQRCDSTVAGQNSCPVGTWCVSAICQPIPSGTQPCTSNTDCGNGLACVNGVCGGTGSDRCDTATGANICPVGLVCINGVCTHDQNACGTQAGSVTSCPPGSTCINGTCQPPTDQCTSDAQCGSGRACINGVCHDGGTTTCSDATGSNACPVGTTCINGVCQGGGTQCGAGTTVGCTADETCVNGQCQSLRCDSNQACPQGYVCDTTRALCVVQGTTGDQCGSATTPCGPETVCVNGQCESLRCDANQACPQGYVCSAPQAGSTAAVCVAQGTTPGQCTADANCPQGRACHNGICG